MSLSYSSNGVCRHWDLGGESKLNGTARDLVHVHEVQLIEGNATWAEWPASGKALHPYQVLQTIDVS